MFKVNNKNPRFKCWMCSEFMKKLSIPKLTFTCPKSTIKYTSRRCFGVFTVNFEHFSFHISFQCFHYCLWASKCQLGHVITLSCLTLWKSNTQWKWKVGSKTAATSKVELFVIIVNCWNPFTIITKSHTLDVPAVLDPPWM